MSEVGRFKCCMLDCIRDSAKAVKNLCDHVIENTKDLKAYISDDINEIVFIGSGTSSTTAITARNFVEKVSKCKTSVVYPSDFVYNTSVYNPNALYVLTSQTGTSTVSHEALKLIKSKGYHNVAISETADTPIAKEADCFMPLDCGIEEYPMRTTGYCASVIVQMMIGMEVGLHHGVITKEDYQMYMEDLAKVETNFDSLIDNTMVWLDCAKRKMLRSELIVFTGADELYGVALEGAMKVWETPQIASVGYEIEEGIHGPNYGYNERHCVIVLNKGGRENEKCKALASYMKDVMHNGFIIGSEGIDEEDFVFTPASTYFSCIEFAAVVQVISYRLANDQGRDLYKHHTNNVMFSYFKTHS